MLKQASSNRIWTFDRKVFTYVDLGNDIVLDGATSNQPDLVVDNSFGMSVTRTWEVGKLFELARSWVKAVERRGD